VDEGEQLGELLARQLAQPLRLRGHDCSSLASATGEARYLVRSLRDE
jgi:hypothetical protein